MHQLIVLLAIQAAPPVPRQPDLVLRWNDVALEAIRSESTPPPVAARNLAILHAAVYEAINAVQRTHWYYVIDARPPECTSAEAAAAVAAHRVLVSLYPRQEKRFQAVLRQTLPPGDSESVEHGIALGQFLADEILAWRASD